MKILRSHISCTSITLALFQMAPFSAADSQIVRNGTVAPTADQLPTGAVALPTEASSLFALLPSEKSSDQFVRLPLPGPNGIVARYLYTPSLAGGIGLADLGLLPSQLGETQIILFRQVGNKLFAEFENHRFQAEGGDAGQEDSVRRSFSASPVWSGDIIRQDAGGTIVNLAGLLLSDTLNVAGRLKYGKVGNYRIAPSLSYIDAAQGHSFPDNVELETSLAFASEEPGMVLGRVVPDGRSLTVRVHHSFIRLPDQAFHPRSHDPRTGTSVQLIRNNYAAGLDEPIVTRLVRRFRLEKLDPAAERSRVRKPIVFYVDRAAPPAIREALMEGVRWWERAFEEAGFLDAFRVELLPPGVNPMDARYNVISWVHGESRSWSTGTTIVDPRTGEIVRGMVQLESLRAWQDKMIFEALAGVSRDGTGTNDDPIVLVTARLRQLAAHEVGHALGLSHNFAASTFADRASVMDYPAPRIGIQDNALDFAEAYASGVGEWDKFAIDWLYRQFPPGTDEKNALDKLARTAGQRGYRFVNDADTRDIGDAQPWGNMWDNGEDAVAELDRVMKVRRIALGRFGLENLPEGAPAAELRRMIVPLYLFHRYQLIAAAKLISGVDYSYAVKGDGHENASIVPADRQRAALKGLLVTLDPAALDLPDKLLSLLSSAQSGTGDRQFDIELLPRRTAAIFDLSQSAGIAADLTLTALLAPERLNRLVEQQRVDNGQLSLPELLQALTDKVLESTDRDGRLAEIRREIRTRYAAQLTRLIDEKTLSGTAHAVIQGEVERYANRLSRCSGDRLQRDHCRFLAAQLTGSAEERAKLAATLPQPTEIPPGAPIGSDEGCWFCMPVTPQFRQFAQ